MLRTRTLAALPLAVFLALAACDNAGEHNDAETNETGADPVTRQDSATVGQQVPNAYPPVGSTSTTPADSNPSPTTPGGAPPAGTNTGPGTSTP
jgi:hypothetical protein